MTRQTRTEIINRSWEAMEGAQAIVDLESRLMIRTLAQITYELAWCVWQMAVDEKRRENK